MLQNRNVSLKNRYRYFVRDYDLKQYVKTFFKRPAVFVFLKETRLFLGRSQLRNHGEGLRGLQPPSAKPFRKWNQKNKRLNVFWTWI